MTLRKAIPLGAAALSLLAAGAVQAQDGSNLVYPIGEDSRFHWGDLAVYVETQGAHIT